MIILALCKSNIIFIKMSSLLVEKIVNNRYTSSDYGTGKKSGLAKQSI